MAGTATSNLPFKNIKNLNDVINVKFLKKKIGLPLGQNLLTSFHIALLWNMNGVHGWKFNYGLHNIVKGAAAEKGQFLSHLDQGYSWHLLSFISVYLKKIRNAIQVLLKYLSLLRKQNTCLVPVFFLELKLINSMCYALTDIS